MPAPQVREFTANSIGGGLALLLSLLGLGSTAALLAAASAVSASGAKAGLIVAGLVVFLAAAISLRGLNTVAPGEARVVQLFGRYRGTLRQDGLRWVNPFTSRTRISARVRNRETAVLKVNDAYGNPIEPVTVVVWKVQGIAQAVLEVDDYAEFVATQTETAVRHIAIESPYDAHDEEGPSLRGNAEEITDKLALELQARVEAAGVRIVESRFTHLAYAPEIASATLQRQHPGAVVAARRQVVDGAVGMVEAALGRIADGGTSHALGAVGEDIVELDAEREAAMVSNLVVVLCGARAPQAVLNSGTLQQ
ncbi:SPFH domain-containing protein [Streptomyces sp. NPDC052107]|uniref:SPFH domain-containing protein n=1 Tax=Streptomyces sp. NPDC052107 TaxID=3155632 RepID=UPI003447DA95